MRKLHELEYNTQYGSHESTTQNGPQKTDFLFPILFIPHSITAQSEQSAQACILWNSNRIQTLQEIVKDVFPISKGQDYLRYIYQYTK